MNESRTCGNPDTQLTRGNPDSFAATRYELIDKDGQAVEQKFYSAKAAADWAFHRWPDQDQDPDRTGRGWDVQVCGS